MNWFLDLRTQGKLLIGFGFMVILLAIVALMAYRDISALQASLQQVYAGEFADAVDIKDVRSNQNATRAAVATMLLVDSSTELDALQVEMKRRSAEDEQALQRMTARHRNDPAYRDVLREFEEVRRAFRQTRESQTIPLIIAGSKEEARRLIVGVQAERNAKMAALADRLVQQADDAARAAVAKAEQAGRDALLLLSIICAIAVALAIVFSLLMTRVLANPLRDLSKAAGRMASGDLTVRLPETARADEAGTLLQTLRQMSTSL